MFSRKTYLASILFSFLFHGCGQKVEKAIQDQTLPIPLKDVRSINTGQKVTVDVSANDSDPGGNLDPSTVSIGVSLGGSCAFNPVAPLVEFVPAPGFRGVASCAYSICDDASNCASSTLEVTVIDKNLPLLNDDFASTNTGTATQPTDVLSNDTDLEGPLDLGSLAVVTSPASIGGSCSISPAAPFVTFTPVSNFAGQGSCSYEVCDTAPVPNCSVATLNVDILDTTPPTLVPDTYATGGAPITFDPTTNDSDAGVGLDPTNVLTTFAIGGTCTITTAPMVEFMPQPGFVGTASCGYKACDLSGNCAASVITVTVTDQGMPIANTDELTTNSGFPSAAFNVASNDIDPEGQLDLSSVAILAAPTPVGGSCAVTTSPNVVFTPNPGFSGVGSCTYEICDIAGNCSTGTINANTIDTTAPNAVNDTLLANSDQTPVAIDVAANDSDPEGNLDPTSVVLSFSVGGSCSFNPAAPVIEFVANQGHIGQASCGYFICDTAGNCSNALVQVTVEDVVQPNANDDFVSTIADTPTQPINVTLNDNDPENNFDLSTVTIPSSPASVGGTCTVATSPNVVFTPSPAFTGVASCPYEVCDFANNCFNASIEITVNDTSFPLVVSDLATTDSGIPVTMDLSANDSDGQGNLDPASITLSFQIGGTCAFNPASPDVEFTPNNGFTGTGSCGYSICDTSLNCASGVFNITVQDAGPPTAVADTVEVDAGATSAPFDVSANDTDAESNLDTTSVTLGSTAPVGGSCSLFGSPLLTFTPNPGFVGTGSCSYEICDGAGNCDQGVVTVNVLDATNPVALDDSTSMNSADSNTSFDVIANDSDPENRLDQTTLSVTANSGGICTAATPDLFFTPNPGHTGFASCGYEICDLDNNCSTATLNIVVTDSQPPVASNDAVTVSAGVPSTPINVVANDSDPEDQLDIASVTIPTSPAPVGGSCALGSASPLVIFTPNAGFAGAGSCTYEICDQSGNCSTASISITVSDTNPPTVSPDSTTMQSSAPNVSFDVLANDTDPEGNLDPSSLVALFGVGGTCGIVSGQIQFTPNAGFIGQGSCGYRVCDLGGNCSDGTLAISVDDGSGPIVNDDFSTTNAGMPTGFINVAANDADPENRLDVTSVTVLPSPPAIGGVCSSTNPPFIVFTPNPGFSGMGSCEYQICDLDGNCTAATVNITVLDSTPPITAADSIATDQNTPSSPVDVSANDSDVEGNLDPSSLTIVGQTDGTCSVAAPNITFTPATDFIGTGTCTYSICDTSLNCANEVFSILVSDITAPTVTIEQSSTQADPTNFSPVAFTITFSEAIDPSTFTVADINGSASTIIGGVYSIINAGNNQDFTVFVHGLNGQGDTSIQIDAGMVADPSGLTNTASTSVDNVVSFDSIAPTGTEINAWTWNLSSPLNTSTSQDGTPIVDLSAASSEDGASVLLFDDVNCLNQVDGPSAIASGAINFAGISYATDGTDDGLKRYHVALTDPIGNNSTCTSIGLSYTLDNIGPTVTVNQLSTQIDPTNVQPIVFDVIFNEEIDPASFTATDITENGTAVGTTWTILPSSDNISFQISANGITGDGNVVPSIAAAAVTDIAGNPNLASTSSDNVVFVDTTPPVVNITSAPTIESTNDQAWPVAGTCSEPGEEVEIILEPGNIPGNILPTTSPILCQADGTWSAVIDTRSINIDGTYNLQAIHYDSLNQSALTTTPTIRQVSCAVTPDPVTDLIATNISQQTVDLIWSIPNDNGLTIVDYILEFRAVETTSDWTTFTDGIDPLNITTITSLNPATLYEFRVRPITMNSCSGDLSNIAVGITKPIHPFFDPFDFELVNVAGATRSRLATLEDGTVVELYNSAADYYAGTVAQTFNMDAGDIEVFDSVKGNILYSEKPIYASGALGGGNPSWIVPLWADKVLLGNQVRSGSFPATVDIYNIEAGSDIFLYEGSTLIDSATNVVADTIVTMEIPNDPTATSINLNGVNVLERSFRIESNGFIMATSYMQNQLDDMPFLPKGRKLLGVPSRAGFLGTSSTTPVDVTIYHSGGNVQTTGFDNTCTDTGVPISLVAGSAFSIMPFFNETCTTINTEWRLYRPDVVYVDASDDIAGNNVADADGGNAAPFVSISLMQRRYILPVSSEWVTFASTKPAQIEEFDAAGNLVATHTMARTGDGPLNDGTFDPLVPYKLQFTNVPPGTRFEGISASDVFVGWYQANPTDPFGNLDGYTRDDETVLYGYE